VGGVPPPPAAAGGLQRWRRGWPCVLMWTWLRGGAAARPSAHAVERKRIEKEKRACCSHVDPIICMAGHAIMHPPEICVQRRGANTVLPASLKGMKLKLHAPSTSHDCAGSAPSAPPCMSTLSSPGSAPTVVVCIVRIPEKHPRLLHPVLGGLGAC